ncbi:MAG: hypothetical protein KAS32_09135 [Candidatus Peribacteraceae bacterium]|nr:hypothetical protein [Candidatus Peribacteraceae bacterium]
MNGKTKSKAFLKELNDLLKKFNAELEIEDKSCSTQWGSSDVIVVDFNFDADLEDQAPQLNLGRCFSGD